MRRLVLILPALFLAGSLSALSVGLGGLGSAQFGASEGFDPKFQFGGGGSLMVAFPVLGWLDVRADLDFFGLMSSDAAGGYLYRGYGCSALALGAYASVPFDTLKGIGKLEYGGGLAVAGDFAGTTYTTLYWFYPEVRAEGFLDFRPDFLANTHCILYVPLRWQLRADMSYCFSTGLGLRVAYSFGED